MSQRILYDWDTVGSRELCEKSHYLYAISVILSEAFRTQPNTYDYTIVHDLLTGEKTKRHTKEQLTSFLRDLELFTRKRGETTTYYEAENKMLIAVFDAVLARFSTQGHFDRLKSHWLKERIHKPILSVLKMRAEQWITDAPSETKEDLLDVLY